MEQSSELGNQQERLKLWFGGFFDGEGCISLSRGRRADGTNWLNPRVRIVSSDKLSVEMMEKVLRTEGVAFHISTAGPSHIGSRHTWRISMNGAKRTKRFLDAFGQYIMCKKPEADMVMKFIESRLKAGNRAKYSVEEIELYYQLRLLHGYRTRVSPETIRRTFLEERRYSPHSERKPESTAEMTVPA